VAPRPILWFALHIQRAAGFTPGLGGVDPAEIGAGSPPGPDFGGGGVAWDGLGGWQIVVSQGFAASRTLSDAGSTPPGGVLSRGRSDPPFPA
jgi:hypothetical protein